MRSWALLFAFGFPAFILPAFAHETLTTTVLFDREIVRILQKHCVMCHTGKGPAAPLETYEQAWVAGRQMRTEVIARHMPPWPALPGYAIFANDNSLTLREMQFMISWVEGLGPRNAGTVFRNLAGGDADRPKEVRASIDFDHWRLGAPQVIKQLPEVSLEPGKGTQVKRVILSLGLPALRLRSLEFQPANRRFVHAAFFAVQETGQWIGSWTPWYGFSELPKGTHIPLPANAHIVAEIHYAGVPASVREQGTLGLNLADAGLSAPVSDLALPASKLTTNITALALRVEPSPGTNSVEVSARKPDGGTQILLFARNFNPDWPTPFVFAKPVDLPRGTQIVVHTSGSPVARVTLSIRRY
jgi:hypothetical protein